MYQTFFREYSGKLINSLGALDYKSICLLASEIDKCWENNLNIFICGNGGSSANANHIANDFIYGVAGKFGTGARFNSLSANTAVITCLANDISYDEIYSQQLKVLANSGDLLICLSGSGNSQNIINALQVAKLKNLTSCSIVGFDGGRALVESDFCIHTPINDMQISEDLQLVIAHMIMQFNFKKKVT